MSISGKYGMIFRAMILSSCFLVFVLSSCSAGPVKLTKAELTTLKPSGVITNGVRVIDVTAKQYEYNPDPIVVISGEQVQLNVSTLDVSHGFSIPEFKINSSLLPGKPETITFKPDAEGKYAIHCTIFCGMGHFVMGGHLVVLPAEKTN